MNANSIGRAFQRLGRSPGSVDVILDRSTFAPGDVVSGVVLLHVTHPVKSAGLFVSLQGYEQLHTVYQDDGSTSTHDACHEFVKTSTILFAHTPLVAGDRQFRFAFQLPMDTPTTKAVPYATEVYEGRCHLYIRYAVECKLEIKDIAFGDQYHGFEFTVAAGAGPIARFVGQSVERSATRTFKYGFWKDGSCAMAVLLGSNVVCIGSVITANVKLELVPDNRLEAVEVSLYRRITPRLGTLSWQKEFRAMKKKIWTRSTLGDGKDSVVELAVPVSNDPLTLTGTYHLVSITYEVVFECCLRRCGSVMVSFPVAVVPSEEIALGALNTF